ncbi:MAG: TetR/AcrR family transcriptional regulator [Phycisphaeraceae bacterium]|nr:TetR/AcrR family transcriptional regulator [Phycisphaeraceae bacterium]
MTTTNHRIIEAVSSPVTPVLELESTKMSHTPVQLSRTQILEATFFCLHEEGYQATTIRRIAKRLDCAIGSIYRYFRDKRDLLLAVTQELLQPVIVGQENASPIDRSIGMYCRLATGDAQAYRLMFWLACKGQFNTDLPEVVKSIIDYWGKQLGSLERAQTLWATLHGLIILSRPEDQILEHTLTLLPATTQPLEVVIMPNLQIPTPLQAPEAPEVLNQENHGGLQTSVVEDEPAEQPEDVTLL